MCENLSWEELLRSIHFIPVRFDQVVIDLASSAFKTKHLIYYKRAHPLFRVKLAKAERSLTK